MATRVPFEIGCCLITHSPNRRHPISLIVTIRPKIATPEVKFKWKEYR